MKSVRERRLCCDGNKQNGFIPLEDPLLVSAESPASGTLTDYILFTVSDWPQEHRDVVDKKMLRWEHEALRRRVPETGDAAVTATNKMVSYLLKTHEPSPQSLRPSGTLTDYILFTISDWPQQHRDVVDKKMLRWNMRH